MAARSTGGGPWCFHGALENRLAGETGGGGEGASLRGLEPGTEGAELAVVQPSSSSSSSCTAERQTGEPGEPPATAAIKQPFLKDRNIYKTTAKYRYKNQTDIPNTAVIYKTNSAPSLSACRWKAAGRRPGRP